VRGMVACSVVAAPYHHDDLHQKAVRGQKQSQALEPRVFVVCGVTRNEENEGMKQKELETNVG